MMEPMSQTVLAVGFWSDWWWQIVGGLLVAGLIVFWLWYRKKQM